MLLGPCVQVELCGAGVLGVFAKDVLISQIKALGYWTYSKQFRRVYLSNNVCLTTLCALCMCFILCEILNEPPWMLVTWLTELGSVTIIFLWNILITFLWTLFSVVWSLDKCYVFCFYKTHDKTNTPTKMAKHKHTKPKLALNLLWLKQRWQVTGWLKMLN